MRREGAEVLEAEVVPSKMDRTKSHLQLCQGNAANVLHVTTVLQNAETMAQYLRPVSEVLHQQEPSNTRYEKNGVFACPHSRAHAFALGSPGATRPVFEGPIHLQS